MRVMGYDYHSYKKQYDDNARKYKTSKGLTDDEYISRMKKTDKFIPVITIVVYYGEKEWDGAKTLHEMLNIPKEVEPFINNYKMLLVEARENNLILHNVNNQDLFSLLEIILDTSTPRKEAKQRAIDYSESHKPDKSVVMTVAGAANIKLDYSSLERGGDYMCTLFQEIEEEGKVQGIAQGMEQGMAQGVAKGKAQGIIEMGKAYNIPEQDIIEKLQSALNITLEQAKEYIQMFSAKTI